MGAGEKFVWVDKCYEIGRVWAPQLALSTDICVASGTLVSPPQIVQASGERFRGKVSFTARRRTASPIIKTPSPACRWTTPR